MRREQRSGIAKGSQPSWAHQGPQPVRAFLFGSHPQPSSLPTVHMSKTRSQSLALISCLAGQHRLWPQADTRPNPGASTSQLGDLSLKLPHSEPGFLIYKIGIRGPTS